MYAKKGILKIYFFFRNRLIRTAGPLPAVLDRLPAVLWKEFRALIDRNPEY